MYFRDPGGLFGLLCVEVCRATGRPNEAVSLPPPFGYSCCVLDPQAAAVAATDHDFIGAVFSYLFFFNTHLILSRQLRKRGRSSLIFPCADRPPHGLACAKFLHSKEKVSGCLRPHNGTFDPPTQET